MGEFMQAATILLIEGRGAGNGSLRAALVRKGAKVQAVNSGEGAVAWVAANAADLIIVDAASLRTTAVRICRRLRQTRPDTPIIHCRAPEQADVAAAQADVYLVQPFTSRKLLNRIRVLLPADDLKEEIVRAGQLTFYVSKRSVDVGGQGERRLTPKLACLLQTFLLHPGQILAREKLMHEVWQTSYLGDTRTLDVHIRWIREIIEENAARPQLLRTVRGVGYIFNPGYAAEPG
jgi:DNA-binding response OmpR family regulator